MQVGGILWGRRPLSAGGGPVLRRRPAPKGRWPPLSGRAHPLFTLRKLWPQNGIVPARCKEFLNASWWYFVGPPPAFGGRRPRAEAAASPQGWPPPLAAPLQGAERPKTSLSPFTRFLIAKGIRLVKVPTRRNYSEASDGRRHLSRGLPGRYLFGLLWLSWSGSFSVGG